MPGLTPDGAAGDEGGTVFDAGLKYLEAVNGNVLVYPSWFVLSKESHDGQISLDTFSGG